MLKKTTFALPLMFMLSACQIDTIKSETVKVYKYDSSVSCNQGSGVSVEVMKQELMKRKVPVIGFGCGNDGLVRVAMCGIETGNVNVFEINSLAYPTARALGYQPLTKLEDFSEMSCTHL